MIDAFGVLVLSHFNEENNHILGGKINESCNFSVKGDYKSDNG